jgi:hypothetical protein
LENCASGSNGVYGASGDLFTTNDNAELMARRFDPNDPVSEAAGALVLNDVYYDNYNLRPWMAMSKTGTLVYAPGNPAKNSLVWVDRDGKAEPAVPEQGPAGPGHPSSEQRSSQPTHQRLPGLGRGVRPQPQNPHGVGRKRNSQRGLRPASAAPSGEEECLRRLLHLQEHGARTHLPHQARFPTQEPNHRILAHQQSRFTHYYFYIRDAVLGPIIVRVASFFPFHATYWLNGHSFIEQELKRKQIGFRKNDNAFLAVDNAAELQAAADRLSAEIIGKQLDYWTFLLGPKFSKKERSQMNLSRFYAIAQIEYCRNFIFKRHFPIHKIFERSCEFGLWRVAANSIPSISHTCLSPLQRPLRALQFIWPPISLFHDESRVRWSRSQGAIIAPSSHLACNDFPRFP